MEIPHGRYVGAKIGIHSPRGEKVGTVGRLTNTEFLFVAGDRALPAVVEGAAA
jgi:adenine-specific DNA-methyltransferase